jgi:hypothetical protein
MYFPIRITRVDIEGIEVNVRVDTEVIEVNVRLDSEVIEVNLFCCISGGHINALIYSNDSHEVYFDTNEIA